MSEQLEQVRRLAQQALSVANAAMARFPRRSVFDAIEGHKHIKLIAGGVAHSDTTGRTANDHHAKYTDAAAIAAVEAEATLDLTGDLTIAAAKSLAVDTIGEKTGAAGVAADGVKLKDGSIVVKDAGYIGSMSDTDAIQIEADGDVVLTQDLAVTGDVTAANIVTAGNVDGVDISAWIDQDVKSGVSPTFDGTNFTGIPSAGVTDNVSASAVITDHTIVRGHGGAKVVQDSGITIDDSDNVASMGTLGCGEVTVADGASINLQEALTFTGATTENLIEIPDNLADALSVNQGVNTYLRFVTTDGFEAVVALKNFAVLGNIVVTGVVDGVDVAARDHAQAHGPSDHTEGTGWRLVYQDTNGDEQEIGLGTDGQVLTSTGAASAPAMENAAGGDNHAPIGGFYPGVLSTGVKVLQVPYYGDGDTFTKFYCRVGIPSAGAAITVQLKRGVGEGASANLGTEASIAIGDHISTAGVLNQAFASGDFVEINITQVGTDPNQGSDLVWLVAP